MATWELLAPRRKLTASKLCRWGGNLTIVVLNTVLARLLFMGGVVATAAMAQDRHWGLLNWVEGPVWLELALAIIALDREDWSLIATHIYLWTLTTTNSQTD